MNYSYFLEYTKSKITKLPYVAKVYPCFMKCSLEKPHVSSELVLWVKTFRMKKKLSVSGFLFYSFRRRFLCCFKKKVYLYSKRIYFLKKTKSLLFVCLHAASTNINPKQELNDDSPLSAASSSGSRTEPMPHFQHLLASLQVR